MPAANSTSADSTRVSLFDRIGLSRRYCSFRDSNERWCKLNIHLAIQMFHSKPLFICKNHCVDDPDNNTEADTQRHPAKGLDRTNHNRWIGFRQLVLKFSVPHEFLVFGRFILPQIFKGHTACKHDNIHGKFLGAEMRIEEMNREDKPYRQQRFIAVNNRGNVDHPPGKEPGEEL